MNGKRFNLLMIGIAGLLGILIFAAIFGANSLLKQRSKKLLDLRLQSQVLSQQQASLAKAKKDIAKYSELNREARIIVPQDKDQAEAVREIVKLAKDTGVNISSILFTSSNLGNTRTSASASSSTTSTATTTSTKAPPISQTIEVKGIKGVYVLPITVQVQDDAASYSSLLSFLNKLEQNRRTAQVVSINIQPVVTNPSQVNFTLTLNAYLKP
ncbi:MAG: hypothetical protein ACXWLH_00575 [Candidatus Saccharimonadales bacterium]